MYCRKCTKKGAEVRAKYQKYKATSSRKATMINTESVYF